MPDKFRPLSKRVGAETTVRREGIMDPAFVQEALESLEHYGVLVFHRLGLTDEEQSITSWACPKPRAALS